MAPAPPLPVTEDTPPDMLAGSMDLRVFLPNGQSVKMSVDRSTPMMDLLVQVTTVNKISPGGHVLQAVGERGILPYKPSTPIGALDTWTIHVVPKGKPFGTSGPSVTPKKAPLKPLNQQPFEQTFRLQVHLPRNQLYVMRVSPKTRLSDILIQTCAEKNLDSSKYEMRHPANLSEALNMSCTLADYKLLEVTVVSKSSLGSALSSSDIMALQREEEKRRQQARQQHGPGTGLGLVFNKRNQSSACEGSVSSDSLGGRSISPARSDESASRSASPPAPVIPPMMAPPTRPARKRRPAPKPPSTPAKQIEGVRKTTAESSDAPVVNGNVPKGKGIPVSHSRNSSDSSGYHEASVLSESPAEGNQMPENCSDSLQRQSKLPPLRPKSQGDMCLSSSMSSLSGSNSQENTVATCQLSTSNSSLASSTGLGLRKKKAPPPPPGSAKTTSLDRNKSVSLDPEPQRRSTYPGKLKSAASLERSSSTESESSLQGQPKLEHYPSTETEELDVLPEDGSENNESAATHNQETIPDPNLPDIVSDPTVESSRRPSSPPVEPAPAPPTSVTASALPSGVPHSSPASGKLQRQYSSTSSVSSFSAAEPIQEPVPNHTACRLSKQSSATWSDSSFPAEPEQVVESPHSCHSGKLKKQSSASWSESSFSIEPDQGNEPIASPYASRKYESPDLGEANANPDVQCTLIDNFEPEIPKDFNENTPFDSEDEDDMFTTEHGINKDNIDNQYTVPNLADKNPEQNELEQNKTCISPSSPPLPRVVEMHPSNPSSPLQVCAIELSLPMDPFPPPEPFPFPTAEDSKALWNDLSPPEEFASVPQSMIDKECPSNSSRIQPQWSLESWPEEPFPVSQHPVTENTQVESPPELPKENLNELESVNNYESDLTFPDNFKPSLNLSELPQTKVNTHEVISKTSVPEPVAETVENYSCVNNFEVSFPDWNTNKTNLPQPASNTVLKLPRFMEPGKPSTKVNTHETIFEPPVSEPVPETIENYNCINNFEVGFPDWNTNKINVPQPASNTILKLPRFMEPDKPSTKVNTHEIVSEPPVSEPVPETVENYNCINNFEVGVPDWNTNKINVPQPASNTILKLPRFMEPGKLRPFSAGWSHVSPPGSRAKTLSRNSGSNVNTTYSSVGESNEPPEVIKSQKQNDIVNKYPENKTGLEEVNQSSYPKSVNTLNAMRKFVEDTFENENYTTDSETDPCKNLSYHLEKLDVNKNKNFENTAVESRSFLSEIKKIPFPGMNQKSDLLSKDMNCNRMAGIHAANVSSTLPLTSNNKSDSLNVSSSNLSPTGSTANLSRNASLNCTKTKPGSNINVSRSASMNIKPSVSLLSPPPPDILVTRQESIESWNKFLQDLNNIVESRAEFV